MILVEALPLKNSHAQRGIGHYVEGLLQSLHRAAAQTESKLEIAALRLAGDPLPWPKAQRVAWRPKVPRARFGWAISRFLVNYDFRSTSNTDLFHATDPNNLCRPAGLRMLATAYDLVPLRFPDDYLAKARRDIRWGYSAMLRRYQSADHLIAISKSTRNDFIEMLDIPPDRITVIYPGIDVAQTAARFPPLSIAWSELPKRFFFYVGAIEPRKNVEAMLEAFAQVVDEVPEHFLLAGHIAPPERERIALLVAKLGIGHRVLQLGMISNAQLGHLYAHATALVFVSRHEGFGLPVLEAMAMGCPVISSDAAALGEIAPGAAQIVPLDDLPALSAAMTSLSTDSHLREQLVEQGLQRALAFDMTKTGQAFLNLYERLEVAYA